MASINSFLSKIKQFELLLHKVNLSKLGETAAADDHSALAEQVQFKTNWELLVTFLSACFVLGFDDDDSKDKFQREFMELVSSGEPSGESSRELSGRPTDGPEVDVKGSDQDNDQDDNKNVDIDSNNNDKRDDQGKISAKVRSENKQDKQVEQPEPELSGKKHKGDEEKENRKERGLKANKQNIDHIEVLGEKIGEPVENFVQASGQEADESGKAKEDQVEDKAKDKANDKVNNLNNKGKFKECKMMNKNEKKIEKCENIEEGRVIEIGEEAGNISSGRRKEGCGKRGEELGSNRESEGESNREGKMKNNQENTRVNNRESSKADNKADHKIDNKVGKEGDKDGQKVANKSREVKSDKKGDEKKREVEAKDEGKDETEEDAKTITKTENPEKDVRNEDKVFTDGGEVHKSGDGATTRSKPSGCLESQAENLNNEQIERQAASGRKWKDEGGEEAEVREKANQKKKKISEGHMKEEDRKEDKNDDNLDTKKEKTVLDRPLIEDRREIAREEPKCSQKNKAASEVSQVNEVNQREDRPVLERLVRKVYQAAGICEQIQRQIELIKINLPIGRPKKKMQIKLKPVKQTGQVYRVDKGGRQVKPDAKKDQNKVIGSKKSETKEMNSVQKTDQREPQTTSDCKKQVQQKSKKTIDVHQAPCDQLTNQYIRSAQLVNVHRSLVLRAGVKGREVYCDEELKSSTTLLIERPFITWLDPAKNGNYCENCFKLVKVPLACPGRCQLVNYCSKECLSTCITHRIECDYAAVLSKFGIFHMATRVLLRELTASNEPSDDCANCNLNVSSSVVSNVSSNAAANMSSNVSSHSCDNLKTDEKFQIHPQSREMDNFHSLIAQVDCNSFTVLICFCLAAIFTSKFLHLLYDFVDFEPDSEFRIAVELLKIALILKQNTMETYDEANGLPIGHALYLACALLNHACKPNCARYFAGNQVVVRSLTALPRNSELTISYGLPSGLDYRGRREQLKERFGFDCLCADCCEESKQEERNRTEREKNSSKPVNEERSKCKNSNKDSHKDSHRGSYKDQGENKRCTVKCNKNCEVDCREDGCKSECSSRKSL